MKYRFFDKIILTGSSKPVNPSNNKYLRTWVFGWLSKTGLTQKDWASIFYKSKGAILATVNFKMDNYSTPKLDGAKPYFVNENGTKLTL